MGLWQWIVGRGGCDVVDPVVVEAMERRVLLAADCPVIDGIDADNRGLVVMHVDRDLVSTSVNSTSVKIFTAGEDGLLGTIDDVDTGASVVYDDSSDEITVKSGLDADTRYMLHIDSSMVVGTNGRLLDGEFNGADQPSGDGVEGGDYEVFSRTPTTMIARFVTTSGTIDVELFQEDAPITVENFLAYANLGIWDGTFFHRSAESGGVPFIIQGGGFSSTTLDALENFGGTQNEFGVSNTRGTIAMAKLGGDPDSASNQWFFNNGDNSANLDNQNGGFTVFGSIVGSSGLDVMDLIATFATVNATAQGSAFNEVPVNDEQTVIDNGGTVVTSDLVVVSRLSILVDLAGEAFGQLDDTGALIISNNSGEVTVTIYDLAQTGNLLANPDFVKVKFNGRRVESIVFMDPFPDAEVGVYVSGAKNVGQVKDNRKSGDGEIAFVVSDSAVGTISFRNTLTGFDLNGFVLPGGLEIGEDADGDGSGDDPVAVFVTGSLGKLALKDGLTGSIVSGEGVRTVSVKGTVIDGDFNIGVDETNAARTSFVFDRVRDTSIRTENEIKSVKAIDWREILDTDGMVIRADTLGTLQITGKKKLNVDGDFGADLVLRGAETGPTLGSAKVAGVLLLTDWSVTGDAGKVKIGSDISNWFYVVSGDSAPITADRIFAAEIRVGGVLSSLTATDFNGGTILAGAVGKVRMKGDSDRDGDFDGNMIVFGLPDEAIVMKKFDVRGDFINGGIDITGHSRDFTIHGDVIDASITTAGDVKQIRARRFDKATLIIDGQLDSLRAERFRDGAIQGRTFLSMVMTGNKKDGINGDLDAVFSVSRVDNMRLEHEGNMSGIYRYTVTLDMYIDGNMNDARIIYTIDLGPIQAVSKLWDVRGGMINSQMFSLSGMGTMQVGWMEDSYVYAGATEAANGLPDRDELPLDGNTSLVYRVDRGMQKFVVKGRNDGGASFINSVVYAGAVGDVTIVRPGVQNFGTPFGLAFGSVSGNIVTKFEDGQVKVRSGDPSPPAVDDYQVRMDFMEPDNA
jgi:cyclophilin family peptidyl-prolyl cis-trans isomerase